MTRVGVLLAVLLVAACNEDLDRQNRLNTLATAPPVWPASGAAMVPPDGVVAQGQEELDATVHRPREATPAMLRRGQEQFALYCAPCHGLDGAADGIIIARGFPKPRSFHEAALRVAPADVFFDAITNGYGAMYSHADRVMPQDRWAIVAYIRALQLSQAGRHGS